MPRQIDPEGGSSLRDRVAESLARSRQQQQAAQLLQQRVDDITSNLSEQDDVLAELENNNTEGRRAFDELMDDLSALDTGSPLHAQCK